MSGFRTILRPSPYQAGIAGGADADAPSPVVPLRPEEIQGEIETSFLTRLGGGQRAMTHDEPSKSKVDSVDGEEADLEVDLEALQKEAEERGRKEAREELADAMRGYEESKTSLEAMAQKMDEMREGWAQQQRETLGALVIQTMERLVSEVPALLDEHLKKGCELAVEHMISASQVDVLVHPDDLELAEEILGEREGWAIMTDDSIRGGCLVEAPSGQLDATLDAALEAVSDAIETWKKESGPQEESGT